MLRKIRGEAIGAQAIGSMGAIEVVRTLNDQHVNTQHPIEVILWSNEEGGTIGSAALLRTPDAAALERTYNGISLRDGLKKIGGDPDNLARARRAAGTLHAYLELHIEQGDTLEKSGASIGIVDGIVSIDDYDVQVIGFANHAGTTAMNNRQDALLAASRMVETVNEVATSLPGRQVGTVGRFNVFPNVPNIIPGRVTLSVEFRDLSADTIAKLGELTSERARQIGKDTRTEISMNHVEHLDAALADARIQQQIGSAADTLGLKTLHLPSGAGHDAQNLAKLGPMGMIFVPSIGGISHSPKELTRWSDVANGADVLLRTVLRVDRTSLPTLSAGHR
ncbi:MAG TPA: hydantoinase/carbamoylase family amidase [Steroidobacteraceae bacterium]